eukprot:COSAG06_NODE_6576_length_2873_cov_2.600216_4_plen_176_part_00
MLYESRSPTKTGSGQTYYLGRNAHKKGWRFDSRPIEIGYDTMEFNMPLIGCNMHSGVTTSHQWFEQWCAKPAENDAKSFQRFVCGCLSRACLDTSEPAHNIHQKRDLCSAGKRVVSTRCSTLSSPSVRPTVFSSPVFLPLVPSLSSFLIGKTSPQKSASFAFCSARYQLCADARL